jgi:hypothetical protein
VGIRFRLEFAPCLLDGPEEDVGTERIAVRAQHAPSEQHAEADGQRGERVGVLHLEGTGQRAQREPAVDFFQRHEVQRRRRHAGPSGGRRQAVEFAPHRQGDCAGRQVEEGVRIVLQQPGRLHAPLDVLRVALVPGQVAQRGNHACRHRGQMFLDIGVRDTGERIQRRLLRRRGLAGGRSLDGAGRHGSSIVAHNFQVAMEIDAPAQSSGKHLCYRGALAST